MSKFLWTFFRNHSHYWGVPHREERSHRLIQVCYECGKTRVITVEIV